MYFRSWYHGIVDPSMAFIDCSCFLFRRWNYQCVLVIAFCFKSWEMKNLRYLVLGILFGIILCKVQAVSWWRMQEMFRFDAVYMYGLFASAVATGALSV